MKKAKRSLAFILALALLSGCFAWGVNARTEETGIKTSGLAGAVQTLELPDANGRVPFTAFYHKAWGSEKQPLVLYFHGAGTVGTYPQRALFQFAPIGISLLTQGRRCNSLAVYDAGISSFSKPEFAEIISQYIAYAVQKGNVDENRIYLIGFSYGGAALRNLTSTFPDYFAAGASLEGVSYIGGVPLIDVYCDSSSDRHVPDPAVASEYMQIPLGDHDLLPLTSALFRGWMDWLFAQKSR